MSLEIGQLLHQRYRIKNVISQGGMGAVYYGTDENLSVEVAIKENLYPSDESSRQFRREATILAGLRHPTLPRVTDHFILPDQGQYLVMDYIGGHDLKQLLKTGTTFTDTEIAKMGVVIADALTYLHTRNPSIIHRDIKPGNIKITSDKQIYLVDFGLARVLIPEDQTAVGAQALTPGFAPPEQYGKGTDSRSDIYSLGASLYNALTGQIPTDGLARALESSTLTPIRQHKPEVSPDLTAVIEKSMEPSAELRFQTAEDFKRALLNTRAAESFRQNYLPRENSPEEGGEPAWERVDSHRDPTVELSGPTQRVADRSLQRKPPKRVPMLLIALISLGFIGVAGGAYFVRNQLFTAEPTAISPAEPLVALVETAEPEPISTPSDKSTPTASLEAILPVVEEATPETEPSLPVPTPNGGASGQIAFTSDRSGIPQIWILNIGPQEYQQVTRVADGACQPAWSPQGDRLVFVSPCREMMDVYKGSSLFIISPDGTGFTPLPSLPGGDYDPSWSPDGKKIAFTSLRDGISHIYVIDLEDKSLARLSSPSSSDRSPKWSPDGESIAFMSTRLGVPQIWIMNGDGGSPREFSNLENGAAFTPAWSPDGKILTFSQSTNLPWLVARQNGVPAAPEVKISDLRPAWNAEFSEDGSLLIFESSQQANLDIYQMTLNGANLTPLTTDPSKDFHPAWRPSGQK